MEANSEKKLTWLSVALTVITMLVAAASELLASGLIPKEHLAYVIMAGVVSVAGSVGVYANGRTKKKVAETLAKLEKPADPNA